MGYPMEQGYITNWGDMEKIWHHVFYNKLGINPEEHPVLISDEITMSRRQEIAKIMFETFNVPKLFIATSSCLALYSSGRTTGVVVNIGYHSASVLPIHAEISSS